MRVLIIAITTLIAVSTAAEAQQAFSINGQMIPLKCSDWKNIGPGSWTQTGTIVAGGMTMTGNTMTNTKETQMLDQQCGSKAQ